MSRGNKKYQTAAKKYVKHLSKVIAGIIYLIMIYA